MYIGIYNHINYLRNCFFFMDRNNLKNNILKHDIFRGCIFIFSRIIIFRSLIINSICRCRKVAPASLRNRKPGDADNDDRGSAMVRDLEALHTGHNKSSPVDRMGDNTEEYFLGPITLSSIKPTRVEKKKI